MYMRMYGHVMFMQGIPPFPHPHPAKGSSPKIAIDKLAKIVQTGFPPPYQCLPTTIPFANHVVPGLTNLPRKVSEYVAWATAIGTHNVAAPTAGQIDHQWTHVHPLSILIRRLVGIRSPTEAKKTVHSNQTRLFNSSSSTGVAQAMPPAPSYIRIQFTSGFQHILFFPRLID